KFRRGGSVAKVALARRLAVRLYWRLRQRKAETQPVRMPGSSGSAVVLPRAGSRHRLSAWPPCTRQGVRITNHGLHDRIDGWWNEVPSQDSQEASLGRDKPEDSC